MRILKAVLGGAVLGAIFFFIPFLAMRILLFVLLIGFLFRAFGRRGRWGRRGGFPFGGRNRFAFADYIRGMSEEEYSRFQKHFGPDCGASLKRSQTESTTASNQ